MCPSLSFHSPFSVLLQGRAEWASQPAHPHSVHVSASCSWPLFRFKVVCFGSVCMVEEDRRWVSRSVCLSFMDFVPYGAVCIRTRLRAPGKCMPPIRGHTCLVPFLVLWVVLWLELFPINDYLCVLHVRARNAWVWMQTSPLDSCGTLGIWYNLSLFPHLQMGIMISSSRDCFEK